MAKPWGSLGRMYVFQEEHSFLHVKFHLFLFLLKLPPTGVHFCTPFCLPLLKHRPDFLAVAGAGGQRITGAELLESILHDVPTHSTLSLAYVPRTRLRLSAAGGGECLGGIKH